MKIKCNLTIFLHSDEEKYTFDRVETEQFFPKDSYIQKCVEADPVRRYLEKARYSKPIYVITGIKTVHGAKAKSVKNRAVGGKLRVEVDGTVWSGGTVPVGGGPSTEAQQDNKSGTKFGGSDDFVFAFRVRKVTVELKTGLVKRDEDYKKGAMLDKEGKKLDVPELSIAKVEDPNAEDEDFEGEELMEGDVVIACGIPKPEDDEDTD